VADAPRPPLRAAARNGGRVNGAPVGRRRRSPLDLTTSYLSFHPCFSPFIGGGFVRGLVAIAFVCGSRTGTGWKACATKSALLHGFSAVSAVIARRAFYAVKVGLGAQEERAARDRG